MLKVDNLNQYYGGSHILRGLSFDVPVGKVTTLLGRNGVGKTTLLKTLMGLVPAASGSISFHDQDITRAPSWKRVAAGIGFVPQGREIFPRLTVEENLTATARAGGRWTLEAVYRFFPRLAERRRNMGSQLSGGEQQMLAIGRALMTNPRLLLLDEATEGLAPLIRAEIWAVLAALRAEGQAILLIDKNLAAVTRLADRHVVVEKGRTVWSGTSAELAASPDLRETYLHL